MKSPIDIWKKWRKGEINDEEMFSRVRTIDKTSLSEQIRLHNEKTKNARPCSLLAHFSMVCRRRAFPGSSLVCLPLAMTIFPFTITYLIPAGY